MENTIKHVALYLTSRWFTNNTYFAGLQELKDLTSCYYTIKASLVINTYVTLVFITAYKIAILPLIMPHLRLTLWRWVPLWVTHNPDQASTSLYWLIDDKIMYVNALLCSEMSDNCKGTLTLDNYQPVPDERAADPQSIYGGSVHLPNVSGTISLIDFVDWQLKANRLWLQVTLL